MKRIIAVSLALALAGVALVLGISSASAHTPSASATCDGVTVAGTDYGQEATLNASVSGGSSDSKSFTGSSSLTVPVPQDGKAHTWSASVTSTHGENSQQFGGSVGPCGPVVPDKPAPVVTHTSSSAYKCGDDFKTVTTKTTTTDWVLDGNVWVKGEPVTTSAAEKVKVDKVACPADTPPTTTTTEQVGVLPNTGGPFNWRLGLVALAFIVAGAGVIVVGRREVRTP